MPIALRPPPLQSSCPLLLVSWGSLRPGMDGEAGARWCRGMTESNPGGRRRTGSCAPGLGCAWGVGVGSAGPGLRVAPGDRPAAPPGRVARELALWLEWGRALHVACGLQLRFREEGNPGGSDESPSGFLLECFLTPRPRSFGRFLRRGPVPGCV